VRKPDSRGNMIEDKEQVVNAPDPTPGEQQEVNTQPETTGAETSEQQTNDTQEPVTQEQGQAQTEMEAVDEKGVPWKNRFYEAERKRAEFAESFPQLVREELAKVTQTKKAEPEYTVEQLESYAMEHPEQRPWVESKKMEIAIRKQAEVTDLKIQEFTKKQQDALIRVNVENAVTSNPRYAECFTTDYAGRKVFNPSHPMTQMIINYLRAPDVANRPDGLAVAAKLAYADYLDTQMPQTQKKVKTLQQSVKKLQRNTLVEGGGTNNVQPVKNKMDKAMDEIRRTGSKEAARNYLKEYLTQRHNLQGND